MKIFPSASATLAALACCSTVQVQVAFAYTTNTNTPNKKSPVVSRRDAFGVFSTAATSWSAAAGWIAVSVASSSPESALAFDGAGSSASPGRSPASKAALKKSWQDRVTADVQDFNVLGAAIAAGELDVRSMPWMNFFVQQQRREPDAVGRTYGALVDLRGVPTTSNSYEGGDGFLLANTFTKTGKPPDNTPAVKTFTKLSKSFDPIYAAAQKGDAGKAKAEWIKAGALLSQYLVDVELPGDLNNPLYK
jgi:hypothetical protein